jgi:CcmD family protein
MQFLTDNAIYVVLLVVLMIWSGLFLYLFRIDKRVRELE